MTGDCPLLPGGTMPKSIRRQQQNFPGQPITVPVTGLREDGCGVVSLLWPQPVPSAVKARRLRIAG